jgi:hypothetical protein
MYTLDSLCVRYCCYASSAAAVAAAIIHTHIYTDLTIAQLARSVQLNAATSATAATAAAMAADNNDAVVLSSCCLFRV